ncbi:MAG: hypothetical protein ACKPEQ_34390, partial [Dolichospermum sp.]
QEIVAKFLKKLDRISHVDKLTWQRIKELPLNSETILELALQVSPKSKTHKYLLEQMPLICAKYIQETNDDSDLDWLPKDFVDGVGGNGTEVLSQKRSPRNSFLRRL